MDRGKGISRVKRVRERVTWAILSHLDLAVLMGWSGVGWRGKGISCEGWRDDHTFQFCSIILHCLYGSTKQSSRNNRQEGTRTTLLFRWNDGGSLGKT